MIKLLLFVFSFFIFCNNGKDGNQLKQVTIHYVNKDIETFYKVTCENFESFFGKKYKIAKITNKKELIQFENIMNNYEQVSLKNLDIRVKIYIYYYNKKVSVLCVDKFGNIEFNNRPMGKNDSIFNFLEKYCEGFK